MALSSITGIYTLRVRPGTTGMYMLAQGFGFGFTLNTVNREYFNVKIFLDTMACAKIKRTKYVRNVNGNAVQGHLSENYRMKYYFRREIFAIYDTTRLSRILS